jgi:hypothetical protein
MVPNMPSKLFTIKNQPKQVRVSSRVFLSSSSKSLKLTLMPSTRSLAIAETSEEEEGDETDDDCTLFEMIKGKSMKTSQEGASFPGGDLLPNHPMGPRAATRKRRTSASPGGAEDEIPESPYGTKGRHPMSTFA